MSEDENGRADGTNYKKRRLGGSCDNCRKRKSSTGLYDWWMLDGLPGDSAIKPGNVCSSCLAFNVDCTHVLASAKKKRGPAKGTPRGQRSIRSIVDSILSAKTPFEPPHEFPAVKQLLTDLALHIKALEEEITRLQHGAPSSQDSGSPESVAHMSPVASSPSGIVPAPPTSYLDSNEPVDGLTAHLRSMGINSGSEVQRSRHFGSVSKVHFCPKFKRPEFWTIHPWQILPEDDLPPFKFPDEDLIQNLVQLYIQQINGLFPILHARSFLKSIEDGLHFEDRHFGAVVLAVCAVGSRFSSDSRVFETDSEHSGGWKWIRQIQPIKKSFIAPPCVYELQLYCVMVIFLNTTSSPHMCWPLISLGLRMAQDVGAHRKRPRNVKPTLESELWKRSFWMLYIMDICISAFLSRPRSIACEDFDVDLPVDCDDEYWDMDDPELSFKQPPGQPSTASYHIAFIKLIDILGYAMRTIYAVRRSDMWNAMGISSLEWNEKMVAELDSSLNKWVDNIPDHLTWDPNRENHEHFRQSAMLHATYYYIQIQVHRTFIARPKENPVLSFPSLAICAMAARSCCRIVEIQERRNAGLLVLPNVVMALFNANIVLLVNVFSRSHTVSSVHNPGKELADIQSYAKLLNLYEKRWESAGRLSDVLMEVISVTREHYEKAISPIDSTSKRPRETSDTPDAISVDLSSGSKPVELRRIAGSNRVSAAIRVAEQHESSELAPTSFDTTFSLPTHSSELGSFQWPYTFDSQSWMQQPMPVVLDQPPTISPSPSVFQSLLPPNTLGTYDLEGYIAPDPNSIFQFGRTQDSDRVTNEWDDWGSYMASVDEVLQYIRE